PISVARTLVPNLKRIAIVGDPPERQFVPRQVAAQLGSLPAEVKLIDLTNLTMKELKKRVASLPDDSAIVYTGLVVDAEGVAYTPHEALTVVAQAANRPVIVQAETQIGAGVAGGLVASPTAIGQQTARLVQRVLANEGATNIDVATADVMTPVF